jgi:aryl-alcohol dehydrogenase-like predicted oxidoreductase
VDAREVAEILAVAGANGIDTLDTAIAYGESERTLGACGVAGWKVITKLPPLATRAAGEAVAEWVRRSVMESLARLRIDRLHGLLLHRSADLREQEGPRLLEAMLALRSDGLVRGIGVSIYDPEELIGVPSIDLVQAPFNVLDRRFEDSGMLADVRRRGAEVHTRSAFLQGLLLMDRRQRPEHFRRWSALWESWHTWLERAGVDPLRACLRFVLSRAQVDRVVVGVDSLAHLRELIAAADSQGGADVPEDLSSVDPDLVNPSRWPRP